MPFRRDSSFPWRRVLRGLISFGVGATLFGILIYISGTESVYRLRELSILPVIGAVFLTLCITLIVAFRWGTLANALSRHQLASWVDFYHYHIVGLAMGFLIPKDVADIGSRTAWLHQDSDISLIQASSSIVIDRFFDLIVSLVFFGSVLPYWLGWTEIAFSYGMMISIPLLLGAVLFYFFLRINRGLEWVYQRFIRAANCIPWLRRHLPDSLNMGNLDRRVFLTAYLMTNGKYWLVIARYVLIGVALSPPARIAPVLVGTPLVQASYLVAVTPGGIGVIEASWFAVLRLAEVPLDSISLFLIAQRIVITLSVVILALVSHGIYLLRHSGRLSRST